MNKLFKRILSFLLVLTMLLAQSEPLVAAALDTDSVQILSTDMDLKGISASELENYYTSEDWEEVFPEGLFVVEYSTYEVSEGGTDPENPEDVYLGIVIYRLGGNDIGSTVTYTLNCVSGDEQMYPAALGTVEFVPQATTAIAKIRIRNDDLRNGSQLLLFSLTEATVGTISDANTAVIQIHDDEPFVESQITMSVEELVTDQSAGGVSVILKRAANDTDYCTLHLATSDGTALAGVDYEALDQDIVFLPGQTEQTVVIPLIQSEEAYTDARNFSVTMSQLQGCAAASDETLRVNITNEREEGVRPVISVDEYESDLLVDESGSLTNSSESVININDNVDRAALLRTVIGTINGTATQSLTQTRLLASGSVAENIWEDYETLTKEDFEQLYTSNGWIHWSADDSICNINNVDLLIATSASYDLNRYDAIMPKFSNKSAYLIAQYPNTAFGYLTEDGDFDNGVFPRFEKYTYSEADATVRANMEKYGIYYLVNKNNQNVDLITNPEVYLLEDADGKRYPNTTGAVGGAQKLFYMLYDDENRDGNYFIMDETLLRRAVIPFSRLDFSKFNEEVTDFEVVIGSELYQSYVQFKMNGFLWTLSVDTAGGGGVGEVPGVSASAGDADRYGFYVGSSLKITYKVAVDSEGSLPVPQVIYLVDSNGNIHNSAALSAAAGASYDGVCNMPLETLLTNNTNTLQNSYYMTEAQAQAHNENLLSGGKCINTAYKDQLGFKIVYSLKSAVSLDFSNMPTLMAAKTLSDGTRESEAAQKTRVYNVLKDVIRFYGSGGSEVEAGYTVDLDGGVLEFEPVEFSYMVADPESAGAGTRLKSNLYDLDYSNFGSKETISYEVCTQITNDVVFTMFNENTTYVQPRISVSSVSVSSKTDSGFRTVYTASSLEDYLNFEVLHYDTDEAPELSYYTVRFVISDIYVGSTTDGVKEYPVSVFYETTNGLESNELLSFIFKGGATEEDAQPELTIQEPDYLNVDSSTVAGVDAEGYKPVLELVDYTANGYEYVLYIPTYYDYHDSDSLLMQTYSQRFRGGDGISLVLYDYDKGDGQTETAVLSTVDAAEMQYVAKYVPPMVLDSEGESFETPYFEEQKKFYTYNDQVLALQALTLSFDTSSFSTILSKLLTTSGRKVAGKRLGYVGGTGPYVQFSQNQIVAGLKISLNASSNFLNAGNTFNAASVVASDPTAQPTTLFSGVNGKKWNTSFVGTGTVSLDAKVILNYNTLTHEYNLTQFTYTGTGSYTISKNIPLACCANLVYANFTVRLSGAITTGGNHVLDYVDSNGVSHFKVTWNGITIAPSFYGSIGAGVGFANLLSAELGASFNVGAQVTFGREKYVAAQQEFDIDSRTEPTNATYSFEFNGSWETSVAADNKITYSYGNTLCTTERYGDVLTIRGVGTAFQLIGTKNGRGGDMEVTVTDTEGNVLAETQTVNNHSIHEKTYQLLYHWELEDYTSEDTDNVNFVVTVRNSSFLSVISLDSIRIYNRDYTDKSTSVPSSLDSASVRVAMYLKFSLIGMTFSFDPAYLLLNVNSNGGSLTIGTIGYKNTWQLAETVSSGVPLLLATESDTATTTGQDYFNTGEYSDARTKSLIQGDISNTSRTQVICHNGRTYAFYTVLDEDTGGTATYYQLYCSVDGGEGRLVCEDAYVADFRAITDGNGDLAVVMTCSDGDVVSVARSDTGAVELLLSDGTTAAVDGSDDLSQALERTCVKLVVLDETTGKAVKEKIVTATDGDRIQDSNPVAVAAGDSSVLFFTSDIKTGETVKTQQSWTSFSDSYADSAMMDQLMNAMYQGYSQLYYTVVTDSGELEAHAIDLDAALSAFRITGFRITEVAAVMVDADTVCLAYAMELTGAEMDGRTGTLKQIHYRQGTLNGDGTITFSDTVVVDSVFDYDAKLSEIVADVTTLSSDYYNSETGEVYDSIVLGNIQLERAVLCSDGGEVSSERMEPCLFYQTNSSINYASYETLNSVLDETAETGTVGVLYDGYFEDYVIAVSTEGAISLIYSDTSETSAYTDTLYLIDYCPEDLIWNKARQLTYTDVFDEDAFNYYAQTGTLHFDELSAFVDGSGKVAIALKSSYAPFSYDYGATDATLTSGDQLDLSEYYDGFIQTEDGEYIGYVTTPLPDYESEKARSDIFMITFADRVTDVTVTDLKLTNPIFVEGEQVSADISIENTGDYMISEMTVSLYYYRLNNHSKEILTSTRLSGSFLSGDTQSAILSYTVGSEWIPDNTLLGVMVTDRTGRITYYDSYTDCYLRNTDEDDENDLTPTYHLINNAAEFYFAGTNVQIADDGMMTYIVDVGNMGTVDAQSDVTVAFRLYSYNPDTGEYTKGQTAFSFTVDSDQLEAGNVTRVKDTYPVGNYLENGYLYYRFELRGADEQYDTDNDVLTMQSAQQQVGIAVNTIVQAGGNADISDGRIIGNLTLGDEIEINSSVLAQYFDVSSLRVYEIGTDCLSIDHSAQDGVIRVKVVALPNDQEGYVKLMLHLKDTVVYRYFYLHISNTDMVDLKESHGDGGWSLSGEDYVYATDHDLLSTAVNGSALTFDFVGSDLKLYGDLLINGGSFTVTIADADGTVLVTDTVSTAAELDNRGMLLYRCDELDYGAYTVTVTAELADGEILVLDHAKYVIDTSGADTTPYHVVEQTAERLDAPLLSGRTRSAAFTLTFSGEIELADGADLSDLLLRFREYEVTDEGMVPTGNTVSFTASGIDGKTLTMTAELSSVPGAVLMYVLSDTSIPEGCLVSADGRAVDGTIPNANTVTYMLRESGIMSVMVAEDASMPSGSVHKSVQVKFMTAPDIERLIGTKLLYTTEDPDGSQRTVEFRFAELTEDPRVAVYRAETLTLETEELTKLFRFQEGIILNESSYVLVTADGDYLENDLTTVISDTSLLNIAYEKLRAEETGITVADGRVQVSVAYPEDVDAAGVAASVQVIRTLTDSASGEETETVLTLPLSAEGSDGTVLTFWAEEDELPAGMTVSYKLLSEKISYESGSAFITRAYDGVAVDPALTAAEALRYNTSAWIVSAEPWVDDGGQLWAEVVFSGVMDETALAQTTLEISVRTTEYEKEYTETVALAFDSAEAEAGCTTARYRGAVSAQFGYEQIARTYETAAALTVPADVTLLTVDGLLCEPAILMPGQLTLQRAKALDTRITLSENEKFGYDVVMTVAFDGPVSAATMTNVYAYVQMQTGTETEEVYLELLSVQDQTLTFVSTSPVILTGDRVITITAGERFADPYGVVTDENGTPVSEALTEAALVRDLTGSAMAASASLEMDCAAVDQITITARIAFAEDILKDSFRNSTVEMTGHLSYLDGQTSLLVQNMAFAGVEDGSVALYTATVTLPADVSAAAFEIGSAEITLDEGALYNAAQTRVLSAALPESEELTVAKTEAAQTVIVNVAEGPIQSLADLTIRVTYPETIGAAELSGISVTVQLAELGPVTFTGCAVENGNTLVLRGEALPGEMPAAPIEINLANAKLELTGGASVWSQSTGLAVSLAVPDAAESFETASVPGTQPDSGEEIPKTGDLLPAALLLMMAWAVAALTRRRRI